MGRRPEGWTLVPSNHPGSPILYVRFRHGGKQLFVSTGETDPTKASDRARQIYAETVSGRRVLSTSEEGVQVLTRRPLDELLSEWLEAVEPSIDETTFDTFTLYVGSHFHPFFQTLDRLAAGTQDYTRARLRRVKRTTVRKELSALRSALAFLVERGYLSRAPEVKTPGPRTTGTPDTRRRHKSEAIVLELEEVNAVLAELPVEYRGAPLRARYTVAWETGLRPETLSSLRAPEDYRKGQGCLRIRPEIDKARYGRTVPLSARAREALDSVCPDVGTIFGGGAFRQTLRSAAARAKIAQEKAAGLTPYDLRHSRATYWVEHSQNLAGVAFLLGHRNVTTLNRYVRPSHRAAEQVLAQAAAAGAPAPSEDAARQVVDGAFDDHLTTIDDLLDSAREPSAATGENPSVRGRGLEPLRITPLDPKSSASASSAILADESKYYGGQTGSSNAAAPTSATSAGCGG